MNPDKLFDYLEGKLSPNERAELEERLMSDPQLRRELTVARKIHADTGDSREIVGVTEPALEERGAVLGRRVAIAFSVLVFANVVFGIYAIAFMKKKERTQLNTEQNRTELA
jgi:anti-sigma factor RsiW